MKALGILYKLRDLDILLNTVTEDVEAAIAELEALQVHEITPEQFAEEMLKIDMDYSGDLECKHCLHDDEMCALLTQLGYEKGVEIFKNSEKWYA